MGICSLPVEGLLAEQRLNGFVVRMRPLTGAKRSVTEGLTEVIAWIQGEGTLLMADVLNMENNNEMCEVPVERVGLAGEPAWQSAKGHFNDALQCFEGTMREMPIPSVLTRSKRTP